MFCVLEFFFEDEAGEKHRLQSFGYETPSEEHAVRYVRAFLRNVTVKDQKPTICLVKNLGGNVLSIVPAPSPATHDIKQETY